MRKIFFLTALMMMILTATAFAEEVAEPNDEPYLYTSEDFQFSILCPIKPVAVVQNPWAEPEKRGEMLVFANEGFDVQYGYVIQVNAFDPTIVPDYNKSDKKVLDEYLTNLKMNNGFAVAELVNITKENKGVFAITAENFEVMNKETGEVEGELVADKQYAFTFFRTPQGRCISIQLLSVSLEEKVLMDTYYGSVASFKDTTNAKADKKKDKKAKKDKKDKKSKKDKDK